MNVNHPYKDFESLPVWKVLEKGIKTLGANGDVVETTARPYIVGFLAKLLVDAGLIATPPEAGNRRAPKQDAENETTSEPVVRGET